jgi:CRP-like cAMP-binding protein
VDHSICTLTLARVATIPTASVLALTELYPRVTRLLWRDTLIEAAVFREWMLSIGRRPAYERTAHLLCELISRLRAVGLADDHCCDLPITQSDLADALGLTAVHVNRMLQQLRDNGFIELHHRKLTVLDWPGLKQAAGFNPAYLYELGEAA